MRTNIRCDYSEEKVRENILFENVLWVNASGRGIVFEEILGHKKQIEMEKGGCYFDLVSKTQILPLWNLGNCKTDL